MSLQMTTQPSDSLNAQEDRQYLAVPPERLPYDPKQSFSLSISSTRTVVEDDLESDRPPTLGRQRTEIASVNLSWFDCLKGLFFGPGKLRRKLTAYIERANPEVPNEKMFIGKTPCPFILIVSVYSCPGSDAEELQQGRCVLDTGCLQGNIISAEFAHRLGFTSFEPLTPREEDGATVATGTKHTVSGAVYISWFHNTSAKVYREMRFLVSESAPVDMVIGTHSIVRHRLIPPPNLMCGANGIRPNVEMSSTPYRDELCSAEVQSDEIMRTRRRELTRAINRYQQLPPEEREERLVPFNMRLLDATTDHTRREHMIELLDALDYQAHWHPPAYLQDTQVHINFSRQIDQKAHEWHEDAPHALNHVIQNLRNDLGEEVYEEERRHVPREPEH